MERTKSNQNLSLPDSINCSPIDNFTRIPNELLRNKEISLKAKALLCILLSNTNHWRSCISGLMTFVKEGRDAISNGLKELEEAGYLVRIKYRNKTTKSWVGSFWAYSNEKNNFDLTRHLEVLEEKGFEVDFEFQYPHPENPDMGNPDMGTPERGFQELKRLSNNKTNDKKKNIPAEAPFSNGFITPNKFADFWTLYPRKVDQGKTLTIWNRICTRKDNRPTWRQIKSSIIHQKQSERWKDIQFIPHPSTWLNQSRWLDNPEEMKRPNFDKPAGKPDKVMEGGEWYYLQEGGYYKSKSGKFYED